MTPIEKRTAEEGLEEPAAKIQKTEEEVEDEVPDLVDEDEDDDDEDEDEDEEFDEDDEDEDDFCEEEMDDDIPQSFSLSDFPDIEDMDEEKLQKFQDAFDAFVEETQESGDDKQMEPMTLEDPAKLRPLPQTVQEMRERIVVAMLPDTISERRMELCRKLEEAPLSHLPDEDDLNELAEEKMMEMLVKVNAAKIGVISEELETIEKEEDKSAAFYHALVLMDCVFDIDAGIFGDGHDADAGKKMLERFAALWKSLFGESDEKLKIDARLRGGVVGYLKSSISELNKGDYTVDDEPNQFADFKFNFEA